MNDMLPRTASMGSGRLVLGYLHAASASVVDLTPKVDLLNANDLYKKITIVSRFVRIDTDSGYSPSNLIHRILLS